MVRARIGEDQEEASVSGGMPRLQVTGPLVLDNSSDPDLTHSYTSVYVEAFTYAMRLPFSSFVNNLLIAINRAPGQLAPCVSHI
ncbi:hypothetical protein LIER_27914 [Lithospermum erythrorhizon]|uniref:Uncharacterized protein n=1 Tax=Lithospermum erythrorhizon TaxID=34254 RepID=A0AAV3RHT9_LITER